MNCDSGHSMEQAGQDSPAASVDPTSHRIIEKRRRDRMNNCLADLSRLVPSCHQRKGRGRIEKTEIIELATKHIRHLQAHRCPRPDGVDTDTASRRATISNRYEEGYRECLRETMQWMVEHEGFIPGDPLCARLMNHLHEHIALVLRGGFPPRPHHGSRVGSLSGSTSGYNGNASSNGSSSDGNSGSTQWPSSSAPREMRYAPPDLNQQALVRLPLERGDPEPSAGPGVMSRYPADDADADFDEPHLYKLLHVAGEVKRAHPPSSSSSRSSEECGGFMYKFKTNMKKRFSADMADGFGSKRCRQSPSQLVPVFALHSKGSLYLPMTVELAALGPQAELLSAEPLSLLHPINISVCFCERRALADAASEQPSTSGVSSLPPETVISEELTSAG
ncbi:hairy/enhancer-of-split related with YRPW motif protein 1-like [Pollicipes pollicipes]|uniref:hairy/enhancer-of-split related with YRPW motif protein 1-like n=1 Tax=Pollicipes pollicipes TaxID=41117 RepID=UPI001885A1B6|nr:hairy/enhancer-of-split related with YRPW motif protein 1-like [Pollicipes pollicipes]